MATPTVPAYFYDIKMTCGGCSGAITRVLTKNISAPNGFKVSLADQKALIWGPELPNLDELTEKLAKTGKEIRDKKVITEQSDLPSLKD